MGAGEGLCVLYGELVEAEVILDCRELLGVWFEYPQPHEAGLVLAADGRGRLDAHRGLLDPVTLPVMRAVDDHGPSRRQRTARADGRGRSAGDERAAGRLAPARSLVDLPCPSRALDASQQGARRVTV